MLTIPRTTIGAAQQRYQLLELSQAICHRVSAAADESGLAADILPRYCLLRYGSTIVRRETVATDDEGKKLKVTDRRMFTADGELRDALEQETAETASAAGGDSVEAGTKESSSDESATQAPPSFSGSLPEPGFVDLVSVLAEPIALFMGDVPLPDGGSAENLELARFHIDLLGVLKDKTESNLSQQESAVLDDLLYRLRMRYVQKSA